MSLALYILFFCSGISGLIYQVIWVRQFGQIFGNTVYSASLVVAIFMLGLGAGSYAFGAWADRRGDDRAGLLKAYCAIEVAIALLGLAISLLLPQLGGFMAGMSSYVTEASGWNTLSVTSYVARGIVSLVLLGPITALMGGTLTVLIRHVARVTARGTGWTIALLYGVNTLGAATGAFLTDFVLAPSLGLQETQFFAVALNLVAALGAFVLSRVMVSEASAPADAPPQEQSAASDATVVTTALALGLSGFAALGIEMLWLRHLGIMLGGFRAVFSLLLTVMLLALGLGALLGGWLERRFGRPGLLLMIVQAVFAAATLFGLALADRNALSAYGTSLTAGFATLTPSDRAFSEMLFNLRPMLLEVALPSLVSGCAFPLANALVQRSARHVGRRAGMLYGANTAGAVCGSLVTGYLLLPSLGMQSTAAVLAATAALAIIPLALSSRREPSPDRQRFLALSAGVAIAAVVAWVMLPGDYLLQRAFGRRDPNERVLTISEGANELLAVVEMTGRGRGLLTNGHAMSSTARLDQRYMRALAHVPLLSMERPERVLVIGFGVGNTTHAASLYPTVTLIDLADLSRNILGHADYFSDANHGVLGTGKVNVFVNDGRTHLQMTAAGTYDLITLEPPPIAHAGVASLYSREFYELAKSRLKPGGYVSQWLPAYQVPADASLAMVRAFVDAFPQSVLLSGSQAELILLGTTASRIEIDPDRVQATLTNTPAIQEDLRGIELGTPRELVSTFVGSSDTLVRATQTSMATIDDRPVQEYGVLSTLSTGFNGVPGSLFDLSAAPAWCPRCYSQGQIAASVVGLDLNFALLQQAYLAPVSAVAAAVGQSFGSRRVMGSAYLGSVLPDSAEVHNILGIAALREGKDEDAILEFEAALSRDPTSKNARANLSQLRYEQASTFMEARRYADAVPLLRVAVALTPNAVEAQNDLGVALASLGALSEAVEHFSRAVALAPQFAEAQRNLAAAQAALR